MAYNLLCRCSTESHATLLPSSVCLATCVCVCVSFSLSLSLSLCLTLPPTPHGFSCYATRVCSSVCVCVCVRAHATRAEAENTQHYKIFAHLSEICLALFVQPVATDPSYGLPSRPRSCLELANNVSTRVLASVTWRVIECPVHVVSPSWLPLPFFVRCRGTHPLLACSALHCATVGSFVMAYTPPHTPHTWQRVARI